MKVPSNSDVYLDSNFLVAYFVPRHKYHSDSVKLFATLLAQSDILHLSPLVVDETLHSIRNEYNYLRKKQKLSDKPHSFFYQQLKQVVDQLITFPSIKVRQFEKNVGKGCQDAVDNIKKYSLAPKDAFSTAYMQEWGIKYIASKDSNFNLVASAGIQRIPY